MQVDVTKIPTLSGNGFIKTSGGDGSLYTDSTTYLTGIGVVDHGTLSGLTDDDHSIYVFKSAASSTRNTISPVGDYTALRLVQGFAEPNVVNLFELQNSTLQNRIWVSPELVLELYNSPTGIYSAINLSYLSGNYTTISKYNSLSGSYTGFTGSVGDLNRYVYTDASRGFTSPISGSEPTLQYHLARLSTVTGLSGYIETQLGLKVSTAAFTGHTGDSSIHYTQAQISITTGQVVGFHEAIDDRLAATLVGGTGIQLVYSDGSDTLTIHYTGSQSSYTNEEAQDAVGSIMTGLSGIGVSYVDGSNSITITYTGSAGVDLTNEPILVTEAPDFLSNYYVLTAGSGISILNNSFASTISVTNWTGLTGHLSNTSNPHSVTASQVGAPAIAQFTGHTGDSSIHFTQASISIPASQISDFTNATNNLISPLSGLFTGHTGDSTQHFTQSQISITASQVSDFSEAVDDRVGVLVTGQSGIGIVYNDGAGLFTITYTGNINTFTPVDYRQATGSIVPASDGLYTLGTGPLKWNQVVSRVVTVGDTPSTIINDDVTTAHIIASGDDSDPTLRIYPYIGSAGNNAEFYTTSGNLGVGIDYLGNVRVNGSITISGGMITGVIIPTASGHAVNKFYVDNLVTAHTSDSTIHFTKESINHTGLSGIGTNTHTQIDDHIASTSNPHTVTAAQVGSPTLAVFTGHTGDSSIHYTQASISIPSSQISDFSEAVDDRVGAFITGLSGIGVVYDDASNLLQITYTGTAGGYTDEQAQDAVGGIMSGQSGILVQYNDGAGSIIVSYTGSAGISDHGGLAGLSDDDHTIYVIKTPATSARNSITSAGDYVTLTLVQGLSETPSANIFQIQNSALADQIWVSPESVLNTLQNPTGIYSVPNLQYLSSNYTTISKYNALSGSYTGFTGSVGTSAFADIGTGIGEVASGTDTRFLSLAKKEQLSFTKISWWQHGTSNWTSSVSGTATAYLGQQRYTTQFQSNNLDPYSVTDCTNNVTGNAAVRYMNNRIIWMSDGRYYKVRAAHTYTGSIRANRVGFYGNDTYPTSNSSPTAGIWFEYNKLSGQTWCAKSCAGGSTGTVDLGITASTNTWFELMFKYWISGNVTGVSYYVPSSSGEAVIGTITGAQVPTSVAQRQGTFFQQAIRHTGVPTDYVSTQVEYFAMSDATGNWTYANAFS